MVAEYATKAGWRQEPPTPEPAEPVYQFAPGGTFILDTPADPEPLWGCGGAVLLVDGEALMIAGPQGVGKTTLAQQLALGRAGFDDYRKLLGFPIQPGAGRVLYLAMDRPQQAARSFRRMVGEAWRSELDSKLLVWPGPPPHDLARHPSLLARLCDRAHADTAIVDSLKDAAIGLSDDEVGAGYNRGRQTALRDGVQVVELHHPRKAPNSAKAERLTIDDVYGSTWLSSAAGSVILLAGAPGDAIVGFHHVKQPASEVGPYKIIHDATTGRTEIFHAADLALLASRPGGLSAVDAARVLSETDTPTANEKEKARRRLQALERSGALVLIDPGEQRTNRPQRWARK
jgi:replicative DNA helicase